MQDVSGFGHLNHKGRAPGGEIVSGTDAGKDAIQRADQRLIGRNKTANPCHQRNQRRLAHIGTFTAHIGAGNNQHSALGCQ